MTGYSRGRSKATPPCGGRTDKPALGNIITNNRASRSGASQIRRTRTAACARSRPPPPGSKPHSPLDSFRLTSAVGRATRVAIRHRGGRARAPHRGLGRRGKYPGPVVEGHTELESGGVGGGPTRRGSGSGVHTCGGPHFFFFSWAPYFVRR